MAPYCISTLLSIITIGCPLTSCLGDPEKVTFGPVQLVQNIYDDDNVDGHADGGDGDDDDKKSRKVEVENKSHISRR